MSRPKSYEAASVEQLSVEAAARQLTYVAQLALSLPNAHDVMPAMEILPGNTTTDPNSPFARNSRTEVDIPLGRSKWISVTAKRTVDLGDGGRLHTDYEIGGDRRHHDTGKDIVVKSYSTIEFENGWRIPSMTHPDELLSSDVSRDVLGIIESLHKGIERQGRRNRIAKLAFWKVAG